MIDATLLMKDSTVFSPWMPRGGDNLRATLEVVEIGASTTIEVEVWTKNSEDPGDGDDSDTAISISTSAVGRTTTEWKGKVKEWVRYRILVTGDNWVLFRMLSPLWFDDVEA